MQKRDIAASIAVVLLIAAFAGAGAVWWRDSTPRQPAAPAADIGTQIDGLMSRIDTLEARHNEDAAQIDSLINQIAEVHKAELHKKEAAPVVALTRHDFELSQGQARELAPGVLVTINHTNVDRQQVSGWVYLQNEHRVLWLKNHGLLQPLTIYNADGKQQQDIVFTSVHDNDAVGYTTQSKG